MMWRRGRRRARTWPGTRLLLVAGGSAPGVRRGRVAGGGGVGSGECERWLALEGEICVALRPIELSIDRIDQSINQSGSMGQPGTCRANGPRPFHTITPRAQRARPFDFITPRAHGARPYRIITPRAHGPRPSQIMASRTHGARLFHITRAQTSFTPFDCHRRHARALTLTYLGLGLYHSRAPRRSTSRS